MQGLEGQRPLQHGSTFHVEKWRINFFHVLYFKHHFGTQEQEQSRNHDTNQPVQQTIFVTGFTGTTHTMYSSMLCIQWYQLLHTVVLVLLQKPVNRLLTFQLIGIIVLLKIRTKSSLQCNQNLQCKIQWKQGVSARIIGQPGLAHGLAR